ncbi:MAG: M20/M25/M40 family metallo-hydrolase [Lachnospiraceae bacterium]
MNERFLEDILSEISVSGLEEPVQEVVKTYMKDYSDEIREDDIGDVICVQNPESTRRIMLSAHADEIGAVISNVMENGRLQVVNRGGIIPFTYPGQQIQIRTKEKTVYGVVEAARETFGNKELAAKHFLVDIGASTKEEALSQVALGDAVVPDTHIRRMMNGRFTARALDDRLGVFIIMEALRRAKEKGCKAGVYAAATVGEETTKNGAYWCASRIKPDLAVVVDVTYCSDYGDQGTAEAGTVILGGGPVLCNSPIAAKKLNDRMKAGAYGRGIPVQIEAAGAFTHTDGDLIHFSGQGVPVVFVSIPLRYMHTPAEVADMRDVENCIELIAEFLCGYEG